MRMAEIRFEELHEEHLPAVLDLYNYYVQKTICTFHTEPLTQSKFRELVFFDSPRYRTFVALDGNELCGYVLLTQHKKREAYNETAEVTLYLKPEHIGKGIGSQALEYIEAFARNAGLRVLVATICGENDRSIRVFERNGFQKCAHYREIGRKFGQLLDVVAYQKILR